MTDLDVDEWAGAVDPPEDPLAALEARVAELEAAVAAKAEKEKREPRFETLGDFVTHLFSWYRRDVVGNNRAWCTQWWEHPEAAVRLHALWLAFEGMRDTEGTWESAWIRDHVDIHMPRLMADDGPFGSCTAVGGHQFPLPPLPMGEMPAEWWTKADSGL